MPQVISDQEPPAGMVTPHTPSVVVSTVIGVLVIAFAIYGFREYRAKRSPLLLLLMLGGVIGYVWEPVIDALGLIWFPRLDSWVGINTFGPVPLWVAGYYALFFGAGAYLILLAMQRGLTARTIWLSVGLAWLVTASSEWIMLHFKLYDYYGDPPFEVLGLPLYWPTMNVSAPLATAVVLYMFPQLFRGIRMTRVLLVPLVFYAASSTVCGLPVFSALRADLPVVFEWIAAVVTMAAALLTVQALAKLIERKTVSRTSGAGLEMVSQ